MKDFIICQICGKKFKQIGTGHLFSHGMTAAEYKNKFPYANFTCQATKEKLKQKAKNRSHQSEETKKQISESMKKIYCRKNFPLNKKNNNQSGKENHFYGKTHTKEAKERIGQASSKWLKEAYKEGRKTSPFKHLGRHNEPSQFEKAIIKVLLPFGFIFDYEVPFNKGSYMIDFALLDKMIAIEVDSKLHDKTRIRDIKKDRFLRNRGWKVYRFRFNAQKNPQIVAQEILIKTKEVLSNEN